MKLQIETVPGPLWGINLWSPDVLGKYRWRKLRNTILAERGPSCTICGREDNPHGHEVWQYTEKRWIAVATLIRIEIICGKCHSVHHWGLTSRLYQQGRISPDSFQDLIRHACQVNRCTQSEVKQHIKEANAISERRSGLEWKQDWGSYAVMIEETQRGI